MSHCGQRVSATGDGVSRANSSRSGLRRGSLAVGPCCGHEPRARRPQTELRQSELFLIYRGGGPSTHGHVRPEQASGRWSYAANSSPSEQRLGRSDLRYSCRGKRACEDKLAGRRFAQLVDEHSDSLVMTGLKRKQNRTRPTRRSAR